MKWRAAVTSKELGISVLDIDADSSADARGKAHTAATDKLGAKTITSVTAVLIDNLPASFAERCTGISPGGIVLRH